MQRGKGTATLVHAAITFASFIPGSPQGFSNALFSPLFTFYIGRIPVISREAESAKYIWPSPHEFCVTQLTLS